MQGIPFTQKQSNHQTPSNGAALTNSKQWTSCRKNEAQTQKQTPAMSQNAHDSDA
jgi:hypothetical protein